MLLAASDTKGGFDCIRGVLFASQLCLRVSGCFQLSSTRCCTCTYRQFLSLRVFLLLRCRLPCHASTTLLFTLGWPAGGSSCCVVVPLVVTRLHLLQARFWQGSRCQLTVQLGHRPSLHLAEFTVSTYCPSRSQTISPATSVTFVGFVSLRFCY